MDLAEQDIVAQLGVSRTPVREAVIKLASEGLIEVRQNRGAWVSELTLSNIRQFFEAFDVTQRMATKFAAMRFQPNALDTLKKYAHEFDEAADEGDVGKMQEANYRFHGIIAANCGNKFVEEQYLKLLSMGLRISHLALTYQAELADESRAGLKTIGRQHRDMLTYIIEGRADEAEDIAREHTETFRKHVMAFVASSSAPAIRT